MARVRLIVWNEAEALERAEALARHGFEVDARTLDGGEYLPDLRRSLPDAILIDLNRVPSKGRYFALAVRASKTLRPIPLVLIGGDAVKVARIREVLPDAAYCDWDTLPTVLKKVLKAPPRNPIRAKTSIATGAPLNDKLGLKPGVKVKLIDPPSSFLKATGLDEEEVDAPDLAICFVQTVHDLEAQIQDLARYPKLWIAWQKQTARRDSGLTMPSIRDIAFAFGLVDYKICAIDKTWSAMLFTRRKANQK
jgi:hypothetical protein